MYYARFNRGPHKDCEAAAIEQRYYIVRQRGWLYGWFSPPSHEVWFLGCVEEGESTIITRADATGVDKEFEASSEGAICVSEKDFDSRASSVGLVDAAEFHRVLYECVCVSAIIEATGTVEYFVSVAC